MLMDPDFDRVPRKLTTRAHASHRKGEPVMITYRSRLNIDGRSQPHEISRRLPSGRGRGACCLVHTAATDDVMIMVDDDVMMMMHAEVPR